MNRLYNGLDHSNPELLQNVIHWIVVSILPPNVASPIFLQVVVLERIAEATTRAPGSKCVLEVHRPVVRKQGKRDVLDNPGGMEDQRITPRCMYVDENNGTGNTCTGELG